MAAYPPPTRTTSLLGLLSKSNIMNRQFQAKKIKVNEIRANRWALTLRGGSRWFRSLKIEPWKK